MSKLQISLEM